MLTITFHAPGNPDLNQRGPVAPSMTWRGETLAEAGRAALWYIARFDLGAGNFAPDPICDAQGRAVATVSYNGRVWAADAAWGGEAGPRPLHDPR